MDFENKNSQEKGIVAQQLGPDYKPVYAAGSNSPSTSNKANFDQWFRDTPNVSIIFN